MYAFYRHHTTVLEFIDPVFVKTSPKRSFSITENEHFGLVFTKTGSINSGTVQFVVGRGVRRHTDKLLLLDTSKEGRVQKQVHNCSRIL